MTLQEQIDRALKALPKEPKRYLVVPKRPRPTGGKKRHAALKLKWHPTTTKAFYKKPEFRGWYQTTYERKVKAYASHEGKWFVIYEDHNHEYDGKVHDAGGMVINHYGPFGTAHAAKVALEANFAHGYVPTGGKKRSGKRSGKMSSSGVKLTAAQVAAIARAKETGERQYLKVKGGWWGVNRHTAWAWGSSKNDVTQSLAGQEEYLFSHPMGGKKRASFSGLEKTLSKRKGVKDPGALAAWIGVLQKYGKRKMKKLAIAGRKRAAKKHARR